MRLPSRPMAPFRAILGQTRAWPPGAIFQGLGRKCRPRFLMLHRLYLVLARQGSFCFMETERPAWRAGSRPPAPLGWAGPGRPVPTGKASVRGASWPGSRGPGDWTGQRVRKRPDIQVASSHQMDSGAPSLAAQTGTPRAGPTRWPRPHGGMRSPSAPHGGTCATSSPGRRAMAMAAEAMDMRLPGMGALTVATGEARPHGRPAWIAPLLPGTGRILSCPRRTPLL